MRTDVQVNFRLPHDLRTWLEAQKEKNRRSLTAEIVIAIQERKERAEQKEAA
ncbi:Arc family DNA-binding protein [Stenotrophomonas acidaminiphila]|jgi:hypothetical protein